MRARERDGYVQRYARVFRRVLERLGADNAHEVDASVRAYEDRLAAMYDSDTCARFSVYPTTDATYVFAVIAMCLCLKERGLTDDAIISAINDGLAARRAFFAHLIRLVDRLPVAWRIVRAWNISDHRKRVADGSIAYDTFEVTEHRVAYSISRCAYVEMFEAYGIRGLCKLFCMTDVTAYQNLTRHVSFCRHCDLSDGPCCQDVICDRSIHEP